MIEDPGGLGYETDYSYDALGNLTQVSQGRQTRSYTYDMLSRLISAATPESGATAYSYTASGELCSGDPSNVCTRTDARGITATYKYDAMNRLTWKNYSDSTPAVNFAYDRPNIWINNTLIPVSNGKGRVGVTCVEVGTSCVAMDGYSYDAMGRVIDHWQCSLQQCTATPPYWHTHYDFDLAGDVEDWTHPAGFTIANNINTAQQVTQMSYSPADSTHPSNLIPSITYTPWGAESALEDGCVGSGCTNAVETYVYNNRMQPVMIELGNTSNASADDCLVYNYYAGVGNPTSCAAPSQATSGNNGNVMGYLYQDNVNTSLSHTESYAYDSLNRLTNAQATGSVSYDLPFSYTADGSGGRYGNVTCVINGNTSGPCPAYSFNSANNRITNSGYTYDAAGDLTSDGTYAYQYDAEGRLDNVTEGGNPFASLTYNANGQMVSLLYQAYGNEQVVGVFSPAGRELGYYDGVAGTWYDRDIWAAGRMVAQSFPASFKGGLTQYLHANALGSDSQITIQTGTAAYDILYYPWGQYWAHAGSQGDSHFAGFQQTSGIASTGTPTRRYSMNQGRWFSPDPLGGDITNPQSLNRYAYALNNPTTNIDPSGLGPGCNWDPSTNTLNCPPPPPVPTDGGPCGPDDVVCQECYQMQVCFQPAPSGCNLYTGAGCGTGEGGGVASAPPPAPKPSIISWPQLQELVQQNNRSLFACDELVDCIIFKESSLHGGFNANAVPLGPGGVPLNPQEYTARGLMQVTLGAAADVVGASKRSAAAVNLHNQLFDPALNIQTGSQYLDILYVRHGGNWASALSSYGTGAGYASDILNCVEDLFLGDRPGAMGDAHGGS